MTTSDRTIVFGGKLYLPGEELPEEVVQNLRSAKKGAGRRSLGDDETSTVAQVLDWVGADQSRAMQALEWESAGQNRSTLMSALNEIIAESAVSTGDDVAEALNG